MDLGDEQRRDENFSEEHYKKKNIIIFNYNFMLSSLPVLSFIICHDNKARFEKYLHLQRFLYLN